MGLFFQLKNLEMNLEQLTASLSTLEFIPLKQLTWWLLRSTELKL